MKTKGCLSILALLASVHVSSGATYNITSGTGNVATGVQDSLGRIFSSAVAAGSVFPTGGGVSGGPGSIAVGYFNNPDSELYSLQQSVLLASFQIFGTESRLGPSNPIVGRGTFRMNVTQQVASSAFSGKAVYVFAGNGTTLASSTEFLVLRANTFTFDPSADDSVTPTILLFNTNNSTLLYGLVVPNIPTTSSDPTTTPGWQTVVPEPSGTFLFAMATSFMLRRRKR